MKKNSEKGFMLVEAFIISAFVLGVLVFMFIQLKTIVNGFDRSFSYNTVSGIYIANELGEFIVDFDYENIKQKVDNDGYANLGIGYYKSYDFEVNNIWNEMLENVNVKSVIIAHENLIKLKENYLKMNLHFPEWDTDVRIQKPTSKLISYINSLKTDNLSGKYRIIVEFNDETFASVKLA